MGEEDLIYYSLLMKDKKTTVECQNSVMSENHIKLKILYELYSSLSLGSLKNFVINILLRLSSKYNWYIGIFKNYYNRKIIFLTNVWRKDVFCMCSEYHCNYCFMEWEYFLTVSCEYSGNNYYPMLHYY